MNKWVSLFSILCCHLHLSAAIYHPLREYSGSTFFDRWDYYGNIDNTTWGNVTYQDRANATSKRLTFINGAGNAVIKVDNTTNLANGPLVYRDSIRLTSQDAYAVGSLILIDALHIPFGCSVWPAFWTLGIGPEWPAGGEIDVVESINLMGNNQVAVHTEPGCILNSTSIAQTGKTLQGDCSNSAGCVVAESKNNSYGAGFAQAGGGVFALQFDVSGIFVWFWSRSDIPGNIRSANSDSSVDTTAWGLPTAAYPASGCNITEMFQPQQLILVTTLCGVWAGVPDIYAHTCHTPTGNCFLDNVVGPGSPTYDNAYWEIRYIRSYAAEGSQPYPAFSSAIASTAATPTSATASTAAAPPSAPSRSTTLQAQPDTSTTGVSRPSTGSASTMSVNWGLALMTLLAIGVALQ